jgi:hypothetical protein
MSRHLSVRATVIALASLAAVAGSTACGAPPDTENTGKGSEALVDPPIRNPIPIPTPVPRCEAPTDPIWTETGPTVPLPSDYTCGCYDIPVPTSLQGIGCTQGVAVSTYDCNGTPWSGWVWACPAEAYRMAADAVASHSFGGQLPWYEDVVGPAPPANACYGGPEGYEVVISESAAPYYGCSPSPCHGTACGSGAQ